MILSYQNFENANAKRSRIEAAITTDHSTSSYGQPVIVLCDGGALDHMSWVLLDYQVEEATAEERSQIMGLAWI